MKLYELMDKASQYRLDKTGSEWLREVAKSERHEDWVIIPEAALSRSRQYATQFNKIEENYSIGAMCELGAIFNETLIDMVLVQFTRKHVKDIKIAIFNGKVCESHRNKDGNMGTFTLVDDFSDEYNKYIVSLELWLNGGNAVKDDDIFELKTIPAKETKDGHCYPRYFTNRAIDVDKGVRDMKKVLKHGFCIVFITCMVFSLTACVSQKEYDEIQSKV